MLTLFAVPKPFVGHVGLIQRNALRSWRALQPACDIIIFGDEEGIAEVAREIEARHEPQLPRNAHGTPLVGPLFERADELARFDRIAYVNADIILLDDFARGVARALEGPFLLTGRRCDLQIDSAVDVSVEASRAELLERVVREGQWYDHTGVDYFVYQRAQWGPIPPFALGRTVWDNWLIFRARQIGADVIDATAQITAIHQAHGYGHVRGGKAGAFLGPEHRENLRLGGGKLHLFDLQDANWRLTSAGLERRGPQANLRRRLVSWAERWTWMRPLSLLLAFGLGYAFHLWGLMTRPWRIAPTHHRVG